MEVAIPGPLALDCEDMFKEITKKLYGEEGALEFPERVEQEEGSLLKPEDHITAFGLAALMQNGFPPPGILHANFQPKTNPAAEDKWSPSEETLQWTSSRIATYNPAQKLFKCVDCECVGFLSRVAEHWLGTHSNARVFQCPQCAYGSAWARCVRLHLVREHNMPDDRSTDALVKNNPVLDEVTKYLQRLKTKIDSMSPAPPPPNQGGRAPQTTPPNAQGATPNKRYGCPACPYATDRRDLFTRHENIHRDEKPFECYVCQKQFNRADHVKKHFLRMHRDHPYDLNRIRRQIPKTPPNYYPKPSNDMTQGMATDQYGTIRQHPKMEHGLHQIKSEHDPTGVMTKGSKKKGEKRYSCCYCPWSGVDNWCLKRHLNTHLKPFVCGLCDYKAARSERLATHVTKVHNKKACGKCSFLAEDQAQLTIHLQEQHHVENRNIKVPNTMLRAGYSGGPTAPVMSTFGSGDGSGGVGGSSNVASVRAWRPPKQQGAARLFNYMEASDGSDQEEYQETKGYPTDERTVQDFLEAGDVANTAGEIDQKMQTTVTTVNDTSPAENYKPGPATKKKLPKKKKSGNKENKKSKFQCNTCSISFKSLNLLNEHTRQHSKTAVRSPLLAANSSQHFTFEPQNNQIDDSSITSWDFDENGRHERRSRKQSQPKKVLQPELDIKDVSILTQNNDSSTITITHTKPPINEQKVSIKEENISSPNPANQLDDIVSKIVQKKQMEHDLTLFGDNKPNIKKMQKRNNLLRNKSFFSSKNDDISLLFRNKRLIRLLMRKFKCKRCQLKFKHKYEIYTHSRKCKTNRRKSLESFRNQCLQQK